MSAGVGLPRAGRRGVLGPFVAAAVAWTAALLVVAGLDARQNREHSQEMASSDARGRIAQDMVYRRWATLHGGVYVPLSEHTPPNPYLADRPVERDVVTTSGRSLTLVNPAYMTRQVHEMAARGGVDLAHITSLKPIRPENGPDPWERAALLRFERGDTLVSEVTELGGAPYMRVMVPMIAEEGCLKCHGDQGYEVGDVRGGLAVTVDMGPYLQAAAGHGDTTRLYLAVLWLIGLSGIAVTGSRTRRHVDEVHDAEDELRRRQDRLEEAQAIGQLGHYTLDVAAGSWTGSAELLRLFGIEQRPSYPVDRWLEVVHAGDRGELAAYLIDEVLTTPPGADPHRTPFDRIYRIVRADDGRTRWVRGLGRLTWNERGEVSSMTGTVQDITDHHLTQQALRRDEERLRILVEVLESADGGLDVVGRHLVQGAMQVTGAWTGVMHRVEAEGRTLVRLHQIPADPPPEAPAFSWDGCTTLEPPVVPRFEATGRPVLIREAPHLPPGVEVLACPVVRRGAVVATVCVAGPAGGFTEQTVDQLTLLVGAGWQAVERARAEEDRLDALRREAELELELQQSRKLETVGRLAGGVAHDFNNMLSVIIGHAELGLEVAGEGEDLTPEFEAILSAGRRSADLTRQLLTFARQGTIEPRALDLNETVGSMVSVLRRIVREEVQLVWRPEAVDAGVVLDPVQVDQVLTNLVVNARDAIDDAGTVELVSRNVAIDEEECLSRAGLIPGPYVELRVRDTGPGISPAIRDRIFEPFFTTKEKGAGTGLGLATVHGIMRQNDGWIEIDDEAGWGAVFRVLFPVRVASENPEFAPAGPARTPAAGEATLLVLEDEAEILRLLVTLLERAGYRVLPAHSPEAALQLAREHGDTLSLLLTDVVMPGRDGRSVADEVTAMIPGLPVVYMSGYAESLLTHKGVLDDGVRLVRKPFTRTRILEAVEDALAVAPA